MKIAANAGVRWVDIAQVVGSIDDPKLLVASSEVENLLALRKDNERAKPNFCPNRNNLLLRILHRPRTSGVGKRGLGEKDCESEHCDDKTEPRNGPNFRDSFHRFSPEMRLSVADCLKKSGNGRWRTVESSTAPI